jgi:hypothetical protein
VSVKVAFSGTPATGSTVYCPVTFHLTDDPSSPLQIAYEGKETSHRYGYMGCNGGFTMAFENDTLATLSPTMQGMSWLKYGTATLAEATIANYQPIAVKDSELIVGTVGATTRNLIHTSARSMALNLVYQILATSSGVEGAIRPRRMHQPPVISGSFTTYRDGSGFDWESAQEDRTELAIFQQLGSTVGGTALLAAPTVQVAVPTDADISGTDGMTVNYKGRNDQAGAAAATDAERSAFRIHLV